MASVEDTGPTLKRRRVDAEQAGLDEQPFEKDSLVWIEDGNLILVCEAEPTRVGFRVYRGLLTQKCEVFRDMFAVCEAPQTNAETYEGCPLVVVHDRPDDLRCLLRFIVEKDFGRDLGTLSGHDLGSLLQMATKYDCPSLRGEIISHLRIIYPSTLNDFRSNKRETLLDSLDDDFDDILGINLGLKFDIPSILPVAVYACCSSYDFRKLYDLSVDNSRDSDTPLAPGGFRRVLGFQEEFDKEICKMLRDEDKNAFMTCNRLSCHISVLRKIIEQDIELLTYSRGSFFDKRKLNANATLCVECVARLDHRLKKIQTKMWSLLPSFCKLGTWEELEGSQSV